MQNASIYTTNIHLASSTSHAKCNNANRHNHSLWQSLSGSSDECRLSARWPPTLNPSQPTFTVSPPVTCYRPHPPSPFIVITRAESRYLFYHHTKGGTPSEPGHWSKYVRPGQDGYCGAGIRSWCLTGNMSKRHFCRIHYTIWRKIYNTIPVRIAKCIAAFSLYIQNRQPYSDWMHSNAHRSHSGIRSRRQYVTDDVGDHVTKHVITRLRRHLAAEESTTWRPHQQPPATATV